MVENDLDGLGYPKAKTKVFRYGDNYFHECELTAEEYIRLCPDGIYTHNGKTWNWDQFFITEIHIHNGEDLLCGKYNNADFTDISLKDLGKRIADEGGVVAAKYNKYFGYVVGDYLRQSTIPRKQAERFCGFGKEGWRMPDHYYIHAKPQTIKRKVLDNVEKMCNLKIDPEFTKLQMKAIYEATTIPHKDVMFAWACISPFLYAMREYISILPILLLLSPNGTKGKTQGALILTKKFWGTIESEAISKDVLTSPSRALEYISTTTLPLLFDECGELNEKLQGEIKTYTTADAHFERKKQDGKLDISDPLIASLVFTMNNLTTLFEDGPILQRTIAIDCDEANFTPEQAQHFREIRNTIQDGTFGKLLYEATKEYTMEDLIIMYNRYPIMGDNPRTDAILKVLEMGKEFASTIFNLSLNLKALPEILNYTQQLCCEPILGLIQEQLAGTNPKAFPTNVDQKEVDKDLCYIYRAIHFSELRNFSRDLIKGIKGLAQLSAILKTKWKDVQYKNVRIDKTASPQKCIVIPFIALPP